MPQMSIPEKLLTFVQKSKRFKIAIGGRGSGKSVTFGDICLMDAMVKGIKTACFREFQNSIDDSVLSLLESEIDRLGLKGFDVQQTKILYNNVEMFKFRGLARNPEGIKSMHGFNRFWVEEAQTISAKSLRALTPTLREKDSEIWMSGNPNSSADPFSQRFIKPFEKQLIKDGFYEDDLHLIAFVNYCDNPFFPDVLDQERLDDENRLSTAEYNHVWLGQYNDSVNGSIINVDWFNAAVDSHKKLGFKPAGALIASHDPSDEGSDAKGYCLRQGSVILDVAELDTMDVNDGCDWALDRATSKNADYFVWDCDGMGISLKRQIANSLEGKKVTMELFRGSSSPDEPDSVYDDVYNAKISRPKTNKQTFKNKRAQYYWRLRDRFYNTYRAVKNGEYIDPDNLISISSDIDCIDNLRAEICRIPRKSNNNGLLQIMSKIDMQALDIQSPNLADSVMMSMIKPSKYSQDFSTIEFSSPW
jgi:phage terminase large subunit